ncbi:hypothetical protein [Helicobacter sp. MIT 01-3238]|uniref:hypothetical protein n=1 Tax=Helicobacter sp. MIT 01-3238 TaxID=398627 RepID=UPI0015F1AB5D|nr:hypothetical protein [Helicobacter sp. MIT 01-3238]
MVFFVAFGLGVVAIGSGGGIVAIGCVGVVEIWCGGGDKLADLFAKRLKHSA